MTVPSPGLLYTAEVMDKHTILVHNTLVELEEAIDSIDARTEAKEVAQLKQEKVMIATLDDEFDSLVKQQNRKE